MVKKVVWLFLLLLVSYAWASIPIPLLEHRVTDFTGTLTTEQISTLESKLASFEAEKGSQIAVLMIATTEDEDIAQFGIRVADAWKIGRKGVNDGVILIIAKNDRKLRLEVGYGLEGVISDAIAKRVISETITPYFKQGDIAQGIDAGITQLMQLIKGEKLPISKQPEGRDQQPLEEQGNLLLLIAGIFLGLGLSVLLGNFWAASSAAIIGALTASLFNLGSPIFVGSLIFILVLLIFNHRNRGWPNGGNRGGSWTSSRSSGSSWGGGGGSFGGGGASGSW